MKNLLYLHRFSPNRTEGEMTSRGRRYASSNSLEHWRTLNLTEPCTKVLQVSVLSFEYWITVHKVSWFTLVTGWNIMAKILPILKRWVSVAAGIILHRILYSLDLLTKPITNETNLKTVDLVYLAKRSISQNQVNVCWLYIFISVCINLMSWRYNRYIRYTCII